MKFARREKFPAWKYRQAYAVILRNPPGGPGPIYDYHQYDPNVPSDQFPEPIRSYAYNPEYFMQLTGWTPGGRYDPMRIKLRRMIKPRKTALFLFDAETGRPITHGSAETAYSAVSPEFLKKITESRLAANFSRSLDRRATTGRIWIYAIVGVVILGVILKITGVF